MVFLQRIHAVDGSVSVGNYRQKPSSENYQQEFKGKKIERPPHWGGFLVKPVSVEFWQGRPNRMHDRILYTLLEDFSWKTERLEP